MKRFHSQDVSNLIPRRPLWRRTVGVMAVVAVGFAAVCGKLAQVQLLEESTWQALAQEQQLSGSILSDKRGTITDRNGVVLAQSVEVATVILRPAAIESESDRRRIADEVSALLSVDREKLYEKTGRTYSRYEVIASKIDTDLRDTFAAWVQENGYTAVFRILQDYKREYPFGNSLSCVIGFTGTDNTGLEGLEAKYNDQLAGKAGQLLTAKNGWGDPLPNRLQYESAVAAGEGNSLTLTVDIAIQRMVENRLDAAVAQTAAAQRTCAIVMDVNTGEILAMATRPDYDLNDPRTLVDKTAQTAILELSGNEKQAAYLTALQRQWKNKAVSEFYEPGSVFKIFTTSMALEENLVSESSTFYCGGTFTMPGVRAMKCHVYPRSHGSQTLAEALSHSCNPSFMTIGSRVGTTLFPKYYAAFGFTQLTGIDMLGEGRVTPSLYHTADAITAVDVATSSIGQTFKVTPIQMITGVSAVANGGKLMTPYTVSRITAPDGTVLSATSPTVRRRVISETTSDTMCRLLEYVVDGGGAKNAYVVGYRVAGKTGTSEKTDQKGVSANGRKGAIASFCGFAPADDPQIAVIVMIDEPQTAIRYGGTLAAPVAQQILSDVLPYWGAQPHYTEDEAKALQRQAPDVTGKTPAAAKAALQGLSLSCRIVGEGTTVTAQAPAPATVMAAGGTVVLYTDGAIPETVTVPAVAGKSLTEANKQLIDAGLNVRLIGWTDRDPQSVAVRNAVAGSQSAAAGDTVPRGTVVELTIQYQEEE